jgi:ADP-ribosylglycohydrolase
MAGAIAEAYYGVPREIEDKALEYLTDDLRHIYYAFEVIKMKSV